MKALQIIAPGQSIITDVPMPQPGPGQVLLRIEAVTTCPQWDLHLRHNEPMFVGHRFVFPYPPGQPGHEATGEIEAVGSGVSDLQPGDRVSAWRDAGQTIPGCYAQFVVHLAENVIRVPAELPAAAVAPLELAMCVGSAFLMLRSMDAVKGRRFAVSGLGPAGLIALQMARAEGATTVHGFDFNSARRDYALTVGLDAASDPREVAADRFPARPTTPAIDCAIDCV
ncbi:MAG TPA: alcohol dehydrogenase catalytic domain-containing protein, partial [Chloroflexota bacterium]